MKELHHVYGFRFISVKDFRYPGIHKELDIRSSLCGEYRVLLYPLTTPSVKLWIKYIE